jgi:hypothetical protein
LARRARQLAEGLTQESDRMRLTEYGEALEDEADALERQASAQPGLRTAGGDGISQHQQPQQQSPESGRDRRSR